MSCYARQGSQLYMHDVFGASRAFSDRTRSHVYSDRNSLRAASKIENCYVSDNALQAIADYRATGYKASHLFVNQVWSKENN